MKGLTNSIFVVHPPYGTSIADVSFYYSGAFKRLGNYVYDFKTNYQFTYHVLAFENLVRLGNMNGIPHKDEILNMVQLYALGALLKRNPDFLFLVHGYCFDKWFIQEATELLRKRNGKSILLLTESPMARGEELEVSKYFDYVYAVDSSALDYVKNATYVGHAYYDLAHRMYPHYEIPEKYKVDVGFVGSFFKNRVELFSRIVEEGFDTYLAGVIDEEMVGNEFVLQRIRNLVKPNPELAKIYNGAKFSPNFLRRSYDLQSTRQTEVQRSMTIRMVETMASGGILVTDKTDELSELMEEGVHYIGFDNEEELIDKLKYYRFRNMSGMRCAAYNRIREINNDYIENARKILDV